MGEGSTLERDALYHALSKRAHPDGKPAAERPRFEAIMKRVNRAHAQADVAALRSLAQELERGDPPSSTPPPSRPAPPPDVSLITSTIADMRAEMAPNVASLKSTLDRFPAMPDEYRVRGHALLRQSADLGDVRGFDAPRLATVLARTVPLASALKSLTQQIDAWIQAHAERRRAQQEQFEGLNVVRPGGGNSGYDRTIPKGTERDGKLVVPDGPRRHLIEQIWSKRDMIAGGATLLPYDADRPLSVDEQMRCLNAEREAVMDIRMKLAATRILGQR